jgi:hypothetical protein
VRTTLDIADPVLQELKRLQRRDGRSLGELVSDLLAPVLKERGREQEPPAPFHWATRSLGAPRVDLGDKEAVYAILDRYGSLASEPPPPWKR